MKRSELVKIVKEILSEEGSTTAGVGGYSTPFAFSKKGQGKNAATKQGERLGYKTVKRPNHPSHTKMFDFLNERGAGPYSTPHAFVSEIEMEDSQAVKKTEELGYIKVKASKKSDIK